MTRLSTASDQSIRATMRSSLDQQLCRMSARTRVGMYLARMGSDRQMPLNRYNVRLGRRDRRSVQILLGIPLAGRETGKSSWTQKRSILEKHRYTAAVRMKMSKSLIRMAPERLMQRMGPGIPGLR